jgi:hypothetical protein
LNPEHDPVDDDRILLCIVIIVIALILWQCA